MRNVFLGGATKAVVVRLNGNTLAAREYIENRIILMKNVIIAVSVDNLIFLRSV